MSDEEKKERRLTERQLWFIWTVINELQGYLNDAIEGGAYLLLNEAYGQPCLKDDKGLLGYAISLNSPSDQVEG